MLLGAQPPDAVVADLFPLLAQLVGEESVAELGFVGVQVQRGVRRVRIARATRARRPARAGLHRVWPDAKWLTDLTEHPTGEGKLYLCAIKDCASNRIVFACRVGGVCSRGPLVQWCGDMTLPIDPSATRHLSETSEPRGRVVWLPGLSTVDCGEVTPGPSTTHATASYDDGRTRPPTNDSKEVLDTKRIRLARSAWRGRCDPLGIEAGADQVERVDGDRGVGIGVLFDDVPTLADAERRWADPDAPGPVEPSTYIAHGGIDELELVHVPEPGPECGRHGVGCLEILRAGWQQRPEADVGCQGDRHARVVAVGECLQEGAAD